MKRTGNTKQNKTSRGRFGALRKLCCVLLAFAMMLSVPALEALGAPAVLTSSNTATENTYASAITYAFTDGSSFTTRVQRLDIAGQGLAQNVTAYMLEEPPMTGAGGTLRFPVRYETNERAYNGNEGEIKFAALYSYHPPSLSLDNYKTVLRGGAIPGVPASVGIWYEGSHTTPDNAALNSAISALTDNQAHQMSQAALWYFSLDKELSSASGVGENSNLMIVYRALVAAAKRNSLPQLNLQISLTNQPALTTDGGARYYGPIQLTSNAIDPSAGMNHVVNNVSYRRIHLSVSGLPSGAPAGLVTFVTGPVPSTNQVSRDEDDYQGNSGQPYVTRVSGGAVGTFYVRIGDTTTDISNMRITAVGQAVATSYNSSQHLDSYMLERSSDGKAYMGVMCACESPFYGEIDIRLVAVGDVELTKRDSLNPNATLQGAKFLLYKLNASGHKQYYYKSGSNPVVWTQFQAGATVLTSGANGKIVLQDLPAGTYYFYEIQAPNNYALPPTEAECTLPFVVPGNGLVELDAFNGEEPPPAPTAVTLELKKLKTGTSTPLAGAQFVLYKQAANGQFTNLIDTKTSDASGQVIFTNLGEGAYRLKESVPPSNYIGNPRVYSFTVAAGASGWVQLTDDDLIDVVTNGTDGAGKTKYLNKFYNQTFGGGGPFGENTVGVKVKNYPRTVTIIKEDAANAAINSLKATFAVYDKITRFDGNPLFTVNTGETTVLETDPFPLGSTLYIKEIVAPEGYALNPAEYTLTVNADGSITLSGGESGAMAPVLENRGQGEYVLRIKNTEEEEAPDKTRLVIKKTVLNAGGNAPSAQDFREAGLDPSKPIQLSFVVTHTGSGVKYTGILTWTTSGSNTLVLDNLPYGTYRIEELLPMNFAPNGVQIAVSTAAGDSWSYAHTASPLSFELKKPSTVNPSGIDSQVTILAQNRLRRVGFSDVDRVKNRFALPSAPVNQYASLNIQILHEDKSPFTQADGKTFAFELLDPNGAPVKFRYDSSSGTYIKDSGGSTVITVTNGATLLRGLDAAGSYTIAMKTKSSGMYGGFYPISGGPGSLADDLNVTINLGERVAVKAEAGILR